MNDLKKDTFEYILTKLFDWYREVKPRANGNVLGREMTVQEFNTDNDFNVLKVVKLLYFVSAVNSRNNGLLNIFDRFVAMPYGHVESDIYDFIKEHQGAFDRFTIGYHRSEITSNDIDNSFITYRQEHQQTAVEVDKAVELLRLYNHDNFILYSAYHFVNMSHALSSWKLIFQRAKQLGLGSSIIPPAFIKNDGQVFILQPS